MSLAASINPTLPGAQKYKADGGFDQTSALGTLLLGSVAGVICGILASLAGYYGFHIIILTPMLIGMGVGAMMAKGIVWTKNRNPWVTALAAVLASFAAIGATHLTDYSFNQADLKQLPAEDIEFALTLKQFQNRDDLEMPLVFQQALADPDFDHQVLAALQVETFPEYMICQAEQGISIGRVGDDGDGANLGFYGTIIYWLIEALIIAGITTTMVWMQSNAPFCTACDAWHQERSLGDVAMAAKQVAKTLEQGRIESLTSQAPSHGCTELQLFRCDSCGSPNHAVVRVNEITYYNGQKQQKNRGSFVVSDEMLITLADVLNRSNDEFAVLNAVEELSQEIRASHSSVVDTGPVADVEHDEVMQEYMAKLAAEQK